MWSDFGAAQCSCAVMPLTACNMALSRVRSPHVQAAGWGKVTLFADCLLNSRPRGALDCAARDLSVNRRPWAHCETCTNCKTGETVSCAGCAGCAVAPAGGSVNRQLAGNIALRSLRSSPVAVAERNVRSISL